MLVFHSLLASYTGVTSRSRAFHGIVVAMVAIACLTVPVDCQLPSGHSPDHPSSPSPSNDLALDGSSVSNTNGGSLSHPAIAQSSKNGTNHTLEIRSEKSQAQYNLTVSESLTTSKTEKTDTAQKSVATGDVGPTKSKKSKKDSVDVIHFSGYITQFSAGGSLNVTLDGHTVSPAILDGSYIVLTTENVTQSTNANTAARYTFSVDGWIAPEKTAESSDRTKGPNTTNIAGTLPTGDRDAFYYAGNITRSTVNDSDALRVFINGQEVDVREPGENSQSSPSPPTTGSSSNPPSTTGAPTPPTTGSPSPPTTDSQSPPFEGTPSSTPGTEPSTTPVIDTSYPYRISNLSVSATTVEASQSIEITVRVSNPSDKRVEADLELATGGEVVDSREVALFSDEWRTITFTHTYETPGNYSIIVGKEKVNITVVEEGSTTQQNGPSPIVIGMVVVGVIGTVGVTLWGKMNSR